MVLCGTSMVLPWHRCEEKSTFIFKSAHAFTSSLFSDCYLNLFKYEDDSQTWLYHSLTSRCCLKQCFGIDWSLKYMFIYYLTLWYRYCNVIWNTLSFCGGGGVSVYSSYTSVQTFGFHLLVLVYSSLHVIRKKNRLIRITSEETFLF